VAKTPADNTASYHTRNKAAARNP